MRMLVKSAGLAAFLISAARAEGADTTGYLPPNPKQDTDNRYILFNYDDWKTNCTFTSNQMLRWTKNSTTTVLNATLWKTDTQGSLQGSIWNSTGDENDTNSSGQRRRTGNIEVTGEDLNDANSVSGSIRLDSSTADGSPDLDAPLFLQVYWEDNGTQGTSVQGSSYSRQFAMNNGGSSNAGTTAYLTRAENANSAFGECTGPNCQTPSSSVGSSSMYTSTAVSTGSSSTSSPSASSTQAAASSSSSGLSTGAIAGIAVACGIVGLALISAAIWFLCCFNRRQRRNGTGHSALAQHHQQNGSYVSDGMARGMRSDKELPHVTDSPQSAFAPNRGLRDSMSSTAMGMGVGAGAGAGAAAGLMTPVGSGNEQQQQQQQQQQPMNVHHQHQHSSVVMSDDGDESTYTPYRDHMPPPTNLYAHHDASTSSQTSLPSSLPPHGGARSPTPPISSRYAHLVEEGMTDEEIRRLEEEERALDVAIEDAGRSSRAQSYTQGRASGGGGR